MRRTLNVFIFLMLIAEGPEMWFGLWTLPLQKLWLVLYSSILPGIRLCEVFAIALLFAARKPRAGMVIKPMVRALQVGILVSVLLVVYGVARGGDFRIAVFQMRTLSSGFLFGLALIYTLETPEHFIALGRAIVFAAVYRAFMCIGVYTYLKATNLITPFPECITTHDDTMVWVGAFFMIVLYVAETKDRRARRFALWAIPVILLALVFNNRRLAWVNMVGAFVALYFLYPPSAAKELLVRRLKKYAPYLIAYVLVGKLAVDRGVDSPVFKPLAGLLSSGDSKNASTASRDAENLGLLVTHLPHPFFGTGFGHEYIEVDDSLSARGFLLYRYVPHNSDLGIFAFTGIFGFTALWVAFPMCIALSTRAFRLTQDPRVRAIAAAGLAECVITMNQGYGDMGLFSTTGLYLVGAAFASAARFGASAEHEAAEHAAYAAEGLS
jgi:hypothetical protein